MSAREEILKRIRRGLVDIPAGELPQDVPVARDYAKGGDPPAGSADAVALLAERLADYGASVRVVSPQDAVAAVADALSVRGATRLVVPQGFPQEWYEASDAVEILRDEPPLPVGELDAADGVITTAATAIAATGTLVLDGGPGQGRRALTLVPDLHLCLVRADQVVASVPEALARLDPIRPLTFISGPSATSDIELDRVEGVHGPRTLEVVLIR
ncbi:LUD domain-containing protein [Streptomyces sp. NPDC004647]|uniref:LutC/YkgG family protein n=1 Tax=Streptomyces sp. NPDC004647 TaxID=3154671 RepID=UPI0033AFDE86